MEDNILVFLEEELRKLETIKEIPADPGTEKIIKSDELAIFTDKITAEIDFLKMCIKDSPFNEQEKEALAYISKLKAIVPTLQTNAQQESAMKSIMQAIGRFDMAKMEERMAGLEQYMEFNATVNIGNWDQMPMLLGGGKTGGADTTNLATEKTLQALLVASGGSVYNYIQSDADATYKYYGYASSTGWKFKRKTLATGVWMVAEGLGDYDTAWADRINKNFNYTT